MRSSAVILAIATAAAVCAPSLRIHATSPLRFTTEQMLPQCGVGERLSFKLTAEGGVPPYQFKAISPASNFALADDGTLTVTPSKKGIDFIDAIVTDSQGAHEQRFFEVVATDAAEALAVGTHSTLTAGAVGQPYRMQLHAKGGKAPYTWSSSGSLPAGMSLSASGLFAGTPANKGPSQFTVTATDADHHTAQSTLSFRIDDVSQPIDVAFDRNTVIQPVIPRIGYNVDSSTDYWNDIGYINQYLSNPGVEPEPAKRLMFLAARGTANKIESDSPHYDKPTGYFDGGKYWIQSGTAKGRAGTILKFERVALADSEFKAVFTLADSDATKVVRTANGLDGDIFMAEAPPANTSIATGTMPPNWVVLKSTTPTTVSVDTASKVGGKQSLKLTASAAGVVGLGQMFLWDNPWRRLRKDTTYRFSAMVRQEGVSDHTVTFSLRQPFGFGQPWFTAPFNIPADGQFHLVTGTVSGNDEAAAQFTLSVNAPGSLWVDNATLSEEVSTTSTPYAPSSATVNANLYDPIPFVVDDFKKTNVGSIRFWYYNTGLSLADALVKPTAAEPTSRRSLYLDLMFAEKAGAKAWIIAAKEWTPEEFVDLAEYLVSTDVTRGMGKLRAEQGHPKPFTQTLEQVFIEYSNEAWNWPNYAYPFDLWHPNKYGLFAKERFAAIKASAYHDPKITLVLNGQFADDYWVNDPVENVAYPAHDVMDVAPYITPSSSVPWSAVGPQMLAYGAYIHDRTERTLAIWQTRNHTTKMAVYEGGPGAPVYNAPRGLQARKDSMLVAATYIDSVAELFSMGIVAYNTFNYQANSNWLQTTGASSRFHFGGAYTMQVFNRVAAGGSQIGASLPANAPTMAPVAFDSKTGTYTESPAVPALRARAYVKNGDVAYFLVNRNPNVTLTARVPTIEGADYAVSTVAASRSDRGTLTGPGLIPASNREKKLALVEEAIRPTEQTDKGTKDGIVVSIPPMGVVGIARVVPPSTDADAGVTAATDASTGESPDASATRNDGAPTGDDANVGCACRSSRKETSFASVALMLAACGLALGRRRVAKSVNRQ